MYSILVSGMSNFLVGGDSLDGMFQSVLASPTAFINNTTVTAIDLQLQKPHHDGLYGLPQKLDP